jgi:hypothetical protein
MIMKQSEPRGASLRSWPWVRRAGGPAPGPSALGPGELAEPYGRKERPVVLVADPAPLAGLSVRRSVGINGCRLSAVLEQDVIGYIEVETFDEGERLTRTASAWALTSCVS